MSEYQYYEFAAVDGPISDEGLAVCPRLFQPRGSHILATSWPHPGHILATSWPHPGHILATSWLLPGCFLARATWDLARIRP